MRHRYFKNVVIKFAQLVSSYRFQQTRIWKRNIIHSILFDFIWAIWRWSKRVVAHIKSSKWNKPSDIAIGMSAVIDSHQWSCGSVEAYLNTHNKIFIKKKILFEQFYKYECGQDLGFFHLAWAKGRKGSGTKTKQNKWETKRTRKKVRSSCKHK